MKAIEFGSKFKKAFKKVKTYPKFKLDKYNEVIDCLVNDLPIPVQYNDHKAASNSSLKDKRILHISPNIVLLYSLTKDTVYLYDIGSHQDTGLTENIYKIF